MKRIVILGGGVGGTIVANQLARRLESELLTGEAALTVVADRPDHVYQPYFLYMALDRVVPAEAKRPERQLLDRRIALVTQGAEAVDADGHTVVLADGSRVPFDYLVIATGSRPAPEQVPGLVEGGHWFYTEEGTLRLRDALQAFSGGRIVITVGVPHKCPVAPLEFTFMLEEWLRQRNLRAASQIVYTYPIGRLHTLEPVAQWATPALAEREVETHTFFNLESVDAAAHTATSLEGETLSYDLLVAVPPHVGADVIARSGLGQGGNWIPTDRHTLLMQDHPDIYVVGDATDLPISKAGSTAHYQAEVVAGNIASRVRGGHGSLTYDGKVFCFIEAGLDRATYIEFSYRHPPRPKPPNEAIHLYKLSFNRLYWLSAMGIL